MTQINKDNLAERTNKGIKALYSRSFFVYILRFFSVLLLSRWLLKEDFGLFAVLNGWIWGISLFLPDLALEVALINKKGEPNLKEWQTFFGISFYKNYLCNIG